VVVLVPDGVATVGGVAARENLAVLPPGAARAGERVRLVLVPQARRVGRAPDGAAVYSSLAVRGRTCPGDALPLRRGDVAAAAAAVKRVIRALVPRGGTPGIDTTGAIVRGSSSAGLAGAPAQADCGPFARRRSVVVDARFPRVTFSAALAHAVYYVAREPRGWVVWGLGPG
jgi:hypothetical protein